MTLSITPNYPCLITSVEPDRSWEGFSATENIPWEGMSWMRNKAVELSWKMSWRDCGSTPLFFLLLVPLTRRTRNFWAASQTTAWQKHGKKKPQLNRRGKERKSSWWPPLWECCKLCFPEALGAPLQRWNLRAWKTGPASPERGDVRCRTTLVDHLVWGRWQWLTFSTVHQGKS